MSDINIEHLRTWVGKSHSDDDLIAVRHARLMAATVDYPEPERIRDGGELPPLWHWTYFLDGQPEDCLGRDGHPARGGFLPPVPLSNRMWAGGRVSFPGVIRLGTEVHKESSILRVDHKLGRSGDLVFVTVLHELKSAQGELLVREEHDIVFKDHTSQGPAGSPPQPVTPGLHTRSVTPGSTTLFRYSALTFNGHRIHYDADYCREVEGYRNLVIHGPLIATLLAGYAVEVSKCRLKGFVYRALSPSLLGDSITLHATPYELGVHLFATLGNGTVCMQAEAEMG